MLNYLFPYAVCLGPLDPSQNYSRFVAEIQASPDWMHQLPYVWFVMRYESLVVLKDKLEPLIYPNDRLLIMPAYGPVAGRLPAEAWPWLNKNLHRAW